MILGNRSIPRHELGTKFASSNIEIEVHARLQDKISYLVDMSKLLLIGHIWNGDKNSFIILLLITHV